ncbi:MAG: DUF6498-containing protein [bacterium]
MKLIQAVRNKDIIGYLRNDTSLWPLLGSNLLTIIIAVLENWSLQTVMLVYWCQSVIIGIINFVRILNLKNFSTDGLKMNNRSVQPTEKSKRSVAFFFLFHYGFFHLIYFVFIGAFGALKSINMFFVMIPVAGFFINHWYSFVQNREKDSQKRQNLGTVLFFPYARIVPMHLTIIFGSILARGPFAVVALVFFLVLKTMADVVMHAIEHA